MKRIVSALAILLITSLSALASQNNLWNTTTGPLSGLSLVQNYNNAFSSLLSNNSG